MSKMTKLLLYVLIVCFFTCSCDVFNYEHHFSPTYENAIVNCTFDTDLSNGMYTAKYGNKIVYFTGSELRIIDLETGSDSMLKRTKDVTYITMNNMYIFYVHNHCTLYQLNYSGEYIASVEPAIMYQVISSDEYIYLFNLPDMGGLCTFALPCSDITQEPIKISGIFHDGLKKFSDSSYYELEDIDESLTMVHTYSLQKYFKNDFIVKDGSVLNQYHYTYPIVKIFADNNLIWYYDEKNDENRRIVDNEYIVSKYVSDEHLFVSSVIKNDDYFFALSEWELSDEKRNIYNHVSDELHKINLETNEHDVLFETEQNEYIVGLQDNKIIFSRDNSMYTYDIDSDKETKIFSFPNYKGTLHVSILGNYIFLHEVYDEIELTSKLISINVL